MKIDALATSTHYLDHIAPVWNNLPEAVRGDFFVSTDLIGKASGQIAIDGFVRDSIDIRPSSDVCLVASFSDMQNSAGRRHILMEHGCGQSYEPFTNPAYAGGMGRESVELFLCPNESSAALNRNRYPDSNAVVIGSPRLEHLMGLERKNTGRTIAFAFHFDLMLCDETRNAWSHFYSALKDLKESGDWEVLGHAHPRIWADLAPTYREMGIEAVRDFDEVVERADVLVGDNSSVLFEFAAAVGPVVVMNAPWYRRDVNHGLRFWEAADVGPQVTDPLSVGAAARKAMAGWPGKEAALDLVFPPVEDPSAAAAQAIMNTLKLKPTKKPRAIPSFPKTDVQIHEAAMGGS